MWGQAVGTKIIEKPSCPQCPCDDACVLQESSIKFREGGVDTEQVSRMGPASVRSCSIYGYRGIPPSHVPQTDIGVLCCLLCPKLMARCMHAADVEWELGH